MTRRFEDGDRVVIVASGIKVLDFEYYEDFGKRCVIKKTITSLSDSYGDWHGLGDFNAPDAVLEHEHVYDSPLYQALK